MTDKITQETQRITRGFILAAGLGSRMRPLTDICPKPLLKVQGKPIIDYALDSLKQAGVTDVIVNVCYLGEMIEEHLKHRTDINITISHEEERLETGGGVKKELGFFNDQPFYVLNGDVIWMNGSVPVLQRLAHNWDSATMDLMLLLYPKDKLSDFTGAGDYNFDTKNTGIIKHRGSQDSASYVFAGPRIVHPRIFENSPECAFSFIELFHKADRSRRLYGAVHDGEWYHLGTPEELAQTEAILKERSVA